jgi:hypothetical protein
MIKLLQLSFLLTLIICIAGKTVKAQDIAADPGAYMNAISSAETIMNKAYMAYVSASAHSSRKKKVEKMREQAVNSILTCQNTITYLPAYKGDNSLRQNSLTFIQLCYKVFAQDYAHIVNMEEIAERSYDEMQAYLLLQEATNDSLKVGNDRMTKAVNTFAAKYGVNMLSEKSELSDKIEATNRLSKYHDKVFLMFFKCNWEDNQLTEAVNQKNVTKIEQTRSALAKYATEGLAVLDTLHGYENDMALANACKEALTFYKDEAENKVPKVSDLFLKTEEFNKLKATMDAKAQSERTQQDVDAYNKAVKDMNTSVNIFNQTNTELNNGRTSANNGWTNTEKQFADTHTPYYN